MKHVLTQRQRFLSILVLPVVVLGFSAGCEQNSASTSTATPPVAPTHGSAAALPAAQADCAVPGAQCPYSAAAPTQSAAQPACSARSAGCDSNDGKNCPPGSATCKAEKPAPMADCPSCSGTAAAKPAVPSADPANAKIAGLPPVACGAEGQCELTPAPAVVATQPEPAINLELVNGSGEVTAPCCKTAPAAAPAAAATAGVAAAKPAAPPAEKIQLQADPRVDLRPAGDCPSCGGR